jgi:hypothetical protein
VHHPYVLVILMVIKIAPLEHVNPVILIVFSIMRIGDITPTVGWLVKTINYDNIYRNYVSAYNNLKNLDGVTRSCYYQHKDPKDMKFELEDPSSYRIAAIVYPSVMSGLSIIIMLFIIIRSDSPIKGP